MKHIRRFGLNSHVVNRRGYLNSLRKSKLQCFFHVHAFRYLTRWIVLHSYDVSRRQCSVLGRNFARCWPEIINNNSNNLYSHHSNNECIGKAQNKSRLRRKFWVSVQAQTCWKRCLPIMHYPLPSMHTYLHDNVSMTVGMEYQTKTGITP